MFLPNPAYRWPQAGQFPARCQSKAAFADAGIVPRRPAQCQYFALARGSSVRLLRRAQHERIEKLEYLVPPSFPPIYSHFGVGSGNGSQFRGFSCVWDILRHFETFHAGFVKGHFTSVPLGPISSPPGLAGSSEALRGTGSSMERSREESGSGLGFFDFRTILYHFVPP